MLRSAHFSILVVGSLLALSACNESPTETDPPQQFVWEARNIGSNGSVVDQDFTADAYIVAVGGVVDTGIIISHAEFGAEYGWLIRAGVCGSDGIPLTTNPTAFPVFTIEEDGIGAISKSVFGFLEGDEEFYVEIYLDPLSEEATLVGCGPMALVEGLPNF
jgi:hypothetical protein